MNTFYMHAWGSIPTSWPMWMVGLGVLGIILLILIIVVAVALKGYALWTAAKRNEKGWFVVLLIVNTFGILELIYLAFVVKKWNKKQGAN